ncbi:armadillo-type protein [Lentinula raphanica]|uniref:Armadillo-type protein n=1 Tax=Lentinula raphanica TaxID=153919 RepID=A0AA38PJT5_9AGAR|nr:armadillo-type protein [Lentinula raphanica]KAJ3844267.1 armadillo-type protein [Lentinula raphanica]KAJ3975567.1 armadillo-type protein [Lentinula raphanica]
MADISALLAALDVFTRTPDKASLDKANNWLQDFQHSPEAWSTCNVLLLSPEAPPAAKVFAAQTFRAKVTYDLGQVDPANLPALRDTLLAALETYKTGPRNIVVQICLALAGLAMQFPAWGNAVEAMINKFGSNPSTVPTLLQFLTLLPEELHTNHRVPITDDEWRDRLSVLVTGNVQKVIDLLTVYIQASGVTSEIQNQIFACLRSWIVSGEVNLTDLTTSPLLGFTFEAISSDQLFDSAVELICDIIHETQEIDDNMALIELIVPRVIALKPLLAKDHDNPDRIRGYARIFAEAGETYRILIIRHTESFYPIVEALAECTAYPDLDIVPITFQFWSRLAQVIGKKSSVSPLFAQAYRSVMTVIIKHLQFPPDNAPLSGQEAEDFRAFRHVMGDTLKDCCDVLETEPCLLATYEMISAALSQNQDTLSWQEIEAPLFALRSMGAVVDPKDDNAVPKILHLIPQLPLHPRVRYAALLIISRYTEWTNMHPTFIQPQLQYISAGFEVADLEVCAAAGQALKYLCQDCKQHLVEVLPTLHTFLHTVASKLVQDDRRKIYEAIAHVISAMPMEKAAESLKSFSLDILAVIHAVANKTGQATKQELQAASDGLENLEAMLYVVGSFGEDLPSACQNTCQESWAIFRVFLSKYGSDPELAERTSRVLRHGLSFFDRAVLAVAPEVASSMAMGFQATGFASYLWIGGKLVGRFGDEKDQNLHAAFADLFRHATNKLVNLLQAQPAGNISDVLDDYVQLSMQVLHQAPDIYFDPATFPLAFQATCAALTVVQSDVLCSALDMFQAIFHHQCLDPSAPNPPNFITYAHTIHNVLDSQGANFIGFLLTGLIGDFPPETDSLVISIFRIVASIWPTQMLAWLPNVLQRMPSMSVPVQVKQKFLADITAAITGSKFDQVRYSVISFHRESRRARDRRRTAALEK